MFLKDSRFIPFAHFSPYENMAIDEYLISYYEKTRQPVFRLYGWHPAGISVGKNQKVSNDINLEKCRKDSIPVVRRATGGGAIFHDNEVTYSIVCSEKDLSEKSITVKESFEKLNAFIIKMYSKCGLAASYAKDIHSSDLKQGKPSAFCFASNEEYDIIINGKKIGGNAQLRKKDLIFQHGSIPLKNNPEAMNYFIKKETNGNYSDLTSLISRDIDQTEVSSNMIAAYTETFNCCLDLKPLEMHEKREIVKLLTSKFTKESRNW